MINIILIIIIKLCYYFKVCFISILPFSNVRIFSAEHLGFRFTEGSFFRAYTYVHCDTIGKVELIALLVFKLCFHCWLGLLIYIFF